MQAYEGYFENGRFYTAGQTINIPERRRVYVILDEPLTDSTNAEAWGEFLKEIKNIDNEPLTETERVKFREVEI